MAITILLEPQEFQPVYNEVITVLSSTNSGQPNFQYVIDVNVDGVNTSRIKVTPNPDGYGVVDLHKHLEPFVNSDIDYSETDTFQLLPNSFIKYDVTLAEQYVIEITGAIAIDTGGFVAWQGQFAADQHHLQVGDKIRISNSVGVNYNGVATVTAITSATRIVTNTVYTGAASADYQRADGSPTNVSSLAVFTGDKFANNSVLNWLDVPSFDEDDYKINSTNVGLLLTTTQTNYVKPESKCYLNFFNSNSSSAGILRLTTDNGVFLIFNDNHLPSTDANKFLTIGCAPNQLENTTDTVIVDSGSLPMFDSDVTSYTVQMRSTVNDVTSQTYTFEINRDCSAYENYELVYLDRFGSFIPFNFDRASKQTISNKKTDFKQNYGSYDSVANTYGWTGKDRGTKRLDTDISELINIQSNWVTEVQGAKVIELMNSPEVYLNDGTQLISINVKTNKLVKKKRITDGLINYKLSFEYSFKNTVQRG